MLHSSSPPPTTWFCTVRPPVTLLYLYLTVSSILLTLLSSLDTRSKPLASCVFGCPSPCLGTACLPHHSRASLKRWIATYFIAITNISPLLLSSPDGDNTAKKISDLRWLWWAKSQSQCVCDMSKRDIASKRKPKWRCLHELAILKSGARATAVSATSRQQQ